MTGPARSGRSTALLVALLCALPGLGPRPASASPVMDRGLERVIYESGREVAAVGLGTYSSTERGLSLVSPSSSQQLNYWLPHEDEGWLGNGVARARFRIGDRPDITLLTRAHLPGGDPEDLNALGLSLTGSSLELYRYDLGSPTRIAPPVSISSLEKGREVELVLYLAGPHLSAHLYDARTLRSLGSLTAHEPAVRAGYTGLRTYRKSDSGTTLTYLSATPAGAPAGSAGSLDDNEGPVVEKRVYESGQEVVASTIGTYEPTAEGLSLVNASKAQRINYWLPQIPQGRINSGVVRARFRIGSRPDITLLTRAQLPREHPEDLDAIGLSLTKTSLELYRYDLGFPQPISPVRKISALGAGREVELVIYLLGPFISAHLYDATNNALLGSLSAHDPALSEGFTGLRTYRLSDSDTKMTSLTVTPIESSFEPGPSLMGNERLVELPATQGDLVKQARAGRIRGTATVDGIKRVWTITDRLGLERLLRRGAEPLSVSAHPPFWPRDYRYMRHRDKPPTPTERGFRMDLSYKNADMVAALIRGYHAKYPDITALRVIGKTHQGRDILALRITDNPTQDEGEPAVLLNAAHHGGELLSTEYALDAMRILLEDYQSSSQVRGWVDALDIWLVPLVNPDGNMNYINVAEFSARKNGRDLDGDGVVGYAEGVDLNRNYPFMWGKLGEVGSRNWPRHRNYRGTAPGSEPETQAMMALANEFHFATSISWHTAATKVLTPYTIGRVKNIRPDIPSLVIRPIVDAMPVQSNGRRMKLVRNLYPVDGVDQDWHFHTHGTLAFLYEGSHFNNGSWELGQRSIAGARPFFQMLLDRVVQGPMITGTVVDSSGQPVEAIVTIDEVQTFNGEEWTSRPKDGHFARMLHKSGTFTVRAKLGEAEVVKTVEVSATGWTPVELVLP